MSRSFVVTNRTLSFSDLALLCALGITACNPLQRDWSVCNRQHSDCKDGLTCDYSTHRCVPQGYDAGYDATVDRSGDPKDKTAIDAPSNVEDRADAPRSQIDGPAVPDGGEGLEAPSGIDVPATLAPDAPQRSDATDRRDLPSCDPPGQDAAPDGRPETEDGAPDLPLLLADMAPDTAVAVPIDATMDSSPRTESDQAVDVDRGEPGDLAQPIVPWEDFRARCPREPWAGGRFIVDGDLVFDEAGLRRYYDAWFAAVGIAPENLAPMGAAATWPSPDSLSLSYCISADFGGNLAAVETAMQAATASWSDRAAVGFTYTPDQNSTCDPNNANVTFDVRPVAGAGYAAASFFPDSPRSARSLLVDESAFAVDSGPVDLEAILRHQLGHTLGFQHEYLWLDPTCTSEDSRLAVRIANYDIDTVMHLPTCRPNELGGTIATEGDLVGAITVYGLCPALIHAIEVL